MRIKLILDSPFFLVVIVGLLLSGGQFLLKKDVGQTVENTKAPSLTENWIVTKVSDGDTIEVRQTDGQELKIRFCGIDSPETPKPGKSGQPFGNEAKAKLESLVAAANNEVMIIPIEKDKYGRTVAEVMSRGKGGVEVSFQEEMLKSGNAYFYKQYAKNCPNHDAFAKAEEIAKGNKAGVWGKTGLEKPWDYRRRLKASVLSITEA
jgi:micrococcal nuclease